MGEEGGGGEFGYGFSVSPSLKSPPLLSKGGFVYLVATGKKSARGRSAWAFLCAALVTRKQQINS